jgi:hypothetical protein
MVSVYVFNAGALQDIVDFRNIIIIIAQHKSAVGGQVRLLGECDGKKY